MAGDADPREFARAFREFLDWVHRQGDGPAANPVVARVRGHLEPGGLEQSVVSRTLPPFEHVNLQVALEHWQAEPGRTVVVEGVSTPPHFGPFALQHLVHGEALPPVRLSAPELVDLPSGPGRTTACMRAALLLVDEPAVGRYVLLLRGPSEHDPALTLEVAGLPTAAAQRVLGEIDALRRRHNVHRGQILELVQGPMGGVTIAFPELARTEREDVVLPETVLHRIERHTLQMAAQRDALRAAGQHLKRGLLLYGPPGTGKTHTMRYIAQHLPGSTVLMLTGRSLHLVGAVSQLARDLEPSVLVLEDVDLVAEDREFGSGPSPVLFELLDSMDGAAADADLLFLLTTNRADLLEPALAARPGRVDVAVEIGLPDAEARRRLLDVYARGVPLQVEEADLVRVVERTEGVTASFIRELLRRTVLEALADSPGEPLGTVDAVHLDRALTDLLDTTQEVTRALLGVPADQSAPPGPVGGMRMGHGGVGWMAAGPGVHYGSSGGSYGYLAEDYGPE